MPNAHPARGANISNTTIMSWTESFPVMDDEMVDEFVQLATSDEKSQLEEWYAVEQIVNAQDKGHVLAMSLFWKPSISSEIAYPVPTREILKDPSALGLELRFEPWPHYVQPILEQTPKILHKFPDVSVRVYLANDLDFLIEDLVEAGCEVFLMRHSSIAHSPGVVWRVLALEEKGRLVTIIDSDRIGEAAADIGRTQSMNESGLGTWRVPLLIDFSNEGKVGYKPFIGCQIGSRGGWPMKLLLHAFTWHSRRGTIPYEVEVPGCGIRPISEGRWPEFGFEEWFLGVAMYPRMAAEGFLTFIPGSGRSALLPLDVEYATWANPNSQLVYFPVDSCCGSSKQVIFEKAAG